ncbi:MAG: hypothetical protein IPK44_01385 [Candidatus Accumulibacter sp.]|jgi:hypothetical protein|uniref:hypothetical protein n=1 Tax=Accumulibacter sp. TaxID=2053492 RepID=UPI0025890199|nr:hypothetical protein [Accumulibacter sp.]MBK8113252.1 hypothetical protein [Accumulibacter sp.]
MILRTLALAAIIALVAAVALALMVLAASVLRPVIAWIASDERTAWGCVATMLIVGLVFVMEGRNRNGTR